MPKTTITYRIFIASPSDVEHEKNIIKAIVNELNNQSLIKNIKLEVIDWELSTRPSIGTDAQDVINTQINDDFDIFVGIFWSRFGTPTKRDTSGTKEEFEIAYKRHTQDPKSIAIMMYFKNAPIAFDDIDPEQIRNIKAFKKEISKRGVLFRDFTNEFETLFRRHLTIFLNEISNNIEEKIKENPKENSIIVLEKNEYQEEELGYFECIELANNNMFGMRDEVAKLTKETTDLGKRLSRRTGKINSLQGKPDLFIQKQSKKIINESSEDLNIFNQNSAPIIPVMTELFNTSMKYYSRTFLIHRDYIKDSQEQAEIIQLLTTLKSSMIVAYDGIAALNESVRKFPPLTTKLIKAKNESDIIMSSITNEFLSFINVIDDVINTSF